MWMEDGLPRVWIVVDDPDHLVVYDREHPDGVPVDMNASLYRQIKAATQKFWKFQDVMARMYQEAVLHPKTVRRVR